MQAQPQEQEEQQPVLVNLIAFDETEYWILDNVEHGELIEKMIGVYLYERNVKTYCCSSSPSFYLHHMRSVAILKDEVSEKLEGTEELELIRDEIDHAIIDAHVGSDNSSYYSLHNIEKYVEDNPDMVYVDDYEYEDFEEARDTHQGNHYLY